MAQGADVILHCRFDLDEDELYVVKWFRGTREFYRYQPQLVPPVRLFPIEDVTVDVRTLRARAAKNAIKLSLSDSWTRRTARSSSSVKQVSDRCRKKCAVITHSSLHSPSRALALFPRFDGCQFRPRRECTGAKCPRRRPSRPTTASSTSPFSVSARNKSNRARAH